jgi:transposase InsO family protein
VFVELSVVERRYHAVMEVLAAGATKTDVAARYGVSRQSVHEWVRRYQADGLGGLTDRSHRPTRHPAQMPTEVEAAVCELRRVHPRWGQRRLRYELGRSGCPGPVPSEASIYRLLVRRGLIEPKRRRRRREDYRRWERPGSMQLWQLDVMGGVFLTSGAECKLVTGVDDHSRFLVIAAVVPRATGRAVCAAFAAALAEYGVPDEILTDNGKQFTGRFGHPRPATEVLFDRICRENGITHRLTGIRSPTTTGKVERFHQSLRRELLDDHPPFTDLPAAQAAIDIWRTDYNSLRPHQSLDMATPASRFQPASADGLPLRLPAGLVAVTDAVGEPAAEPVAERPAEPPAVPAIAEPPEVVVSAEELVGPPDAVELDRMVPPSGNLAVGRQQFWFGPRLAGQQLTLWMDSTTVHISLDGLRVKTVPSRLNTADLARLRSTPGSRPAGPPPAPRAAGPLAARLPIQVDRTANAVGVVSLAGTAVPIGFQYAGRRVTLRLDGPLLHLIVDGVLTRTMPAPVPADQRYRLRDARLAGPLPAPPVGPARVQRKVSSRGGIQVCNQRVQVGMTHARKIVTVEVDQTVLRILDSTGTVLTVVARTNTEEVTRHKAYGTMNRTTG